MARKPQVTRTITTTKVTVLGMDVEKCEPMNETFTVPRTYKDEDKLMKAVKDAGETDTFKIVKIVDTQVEETLYGMSEQEFIEHAHVLPPRAQATQETAE